jgi:transglutaminase-like putative cysteine protease
LKRDTLETMIATLETVDHQGVEWANVRWTAYLIHQHLRYEYPGEIHDLRQRLMIVPPERHGGQRLVTHKLEVSAPFVEIARDDDRFGNHVIDLFIEHVERAVDFTAWIVVEREVTQDPARLPAHTDLLPFTEPSPLTMPDDALRAVASELQAAGGDAVTLAGRINDWVHGALTYGHDITSVKTPAALALAGGKGVCQDYAHIMLALCRLCGLPARYVSGHLLGEGGTHAWVDLLLPDPGEPGGFIAHPYDPTNGCIPGLKYITVAVGRDYDDVAPTSGTYRAPYAGHLTTHKRAAVTDLAYFPTKST